MPAKPVRSPLGLRPHLRLPQQPRLLLLPPVMPLLRPRRTILRPGNRREARSGMSEKQLASTARAAAHQKAWFAELRRDVFERQLPYAITQADMPLELFHAMDIPV